MRLINAYNIQFNEDDRAQRALNIFPDINGQINISYVNSTKHIVAWHKHFKQTDYWYCIKGSFKVGLAYPDGDRYKVVWEYLSDKNPKGLQIPPGIYHGYKALQPESSLLYFLTEKYNPDDEYKVPPGYFNENWEAENK